LSRSAGRAVLLVAEATVAWHLLRGGGARVTAASQLVACRRSTRESGDATLRGR